MARNDKDYAQTVADAIIKQLEEGTAPWQRPWDGGSKFLPHNPVSGTSYKGVNALYLMAVQDQKGYDDPRWMTYNQAGKLGGQVRKGEKSTTVQYWQWTKEQDVTDAQGRPVLGADGKPEKETVRLDRPWVKNFSVFNAEQIDGLPPPAERPQLPEFERVERAEAIIENSGARIEHKTGDRAFYQPSTDRIVLPAKEQFASQGGYYGTALHELGHWTGHPERLDRDLAHPFGSEGYAREELRAEIASMMLADEIGVEHDPEQHAAYVGSWIKALREDPTEIMRAAADAQKINRFVMQFDPQTQKLAQERGRERPKAALPTAREAEAERLGAELAQAAESHATPGNERTDRKAAFEGATFALTDAVLGAQRGQAFEGAGKSLAGLPGVWLSGGLSRADGQEIIAASSTAADYIDELTDAIGATESRDLARAYRATGDDRDGERIDNAELASVVWQELHRNSSSRPPEPEWYVAPEDRTHPLTAAVTGEIGITDALVTKMGSELMAQKRARDEAKESAKIIAQEDTPLTAGFRERQAVKELGAKWNKDEKHWFVPKGEDLAPFAAWLPTQGQAQSAGVTLSPVETAQRALDEAEKRLADWPNIEARLLKQENDERREFIAASDAGSLSNEETAAASAQLANWPEYRQHVFEGLVDDRDAAREALEDATKAHHVAANDDAPERAATGAVKTAEKRIATEKTYLDVPYDERHVAKAAGAKWDKAARSWYAPEGTDLAPLSQFAAGPAAQATSAPQDVLQRFADALQQAGLRVSGVPQMDGRIHRVPVDGDTGKERSGAYKGYLDGRPAGYIENFKTGEKQNWKADVALKLTPAERHALAVEAQQRREDREQQQAVAFDKAAEIAVALVATTQAAEAEHPYLARKGVAPNGIRQATEQTVAQADEAFGKGKHAIAAGDLILPMQRAGGETRSLQVIKADGWKGFMPGGQVSGMYAMLGDPQAAPDRPQWVAEGFATAASVHEARDGDPVAVAFNAANLSAVAKEMREQGPERELFIAGDDDRHLPFKDPPRPNIGRDKAEEAAQAAQAVAVLPTFGPEQDGIDWNDVAQQEGLAGLSRELNDSVTRAQRRDYREKVEAHQRPESLAARTEDRLDTMQEAVAAFRHYGGSEGLAADRAAFVSASTPGQTQTADLEAVHAAPELETSQSTGRGLSRGRGR